MARKMKVRATQKKGFAKIKAILFHPMDTGLRKDKKTGETIPAHFIKEVMVKHQDKLVMTINMSIAVSRNPYLSIEVDGTQKGDTLNISWVDNLGETASKDVTIG